MPICHTPNLPDLQRNGIPGGVCHSTTVTVTLNDLKCRLENTAFDHWNNSEFTKWGPQNVLHVYEKQVVLDQMFT